MACRHLSFALLLARVPVVYGLRYGDEADETAARRASCDDVMAAEESSSGAMRHGFYAAKGNDGTVWCKCSDHGSRLFCGQELYAGPGLVAKSEGRKFDLSALQCDSALYCNVKAKAVGSIPPMSPAKADDVLPPMLSNEELDFSICIVTANTETGTSQEGSFTAALLERCQPANIVVVAQQESSTTLNAAGFAQVAQCATVTSGGWGLFKKLGIQNTTVTVLARTAFKGSFTQEACTVVREGFNPGKGTAIVSVQTPRGRLVAASTHSTHGGIEEPDRVKGFHDAVKKIIGFAPTYVAWAGDFNPRTPITPELESALLDGEHTGEENFQMLAEQPDFLGREGVTFDAELEEASQGALKQLDVRHMCPSYRKSADENKPRFACQSPGSTEEELYFSPQDGKTQWNDNGPHSNRAPSWTERIMVTEEMSGGCDRTEKIKSKEDHDIVLVKCFL
eukprot:TRINITY_DN75344_c0_g1_i1.p1 TRINITY_DN75344_c0_g1~~TRINITY_DN75344_c0_g1_i1.p1  ORF type:complete len:452 (+),score=55.44 TRINITY_DN75344_c0_g1_i1:163-1518(+)